jgi:hypothetical protein
MKHLRFKIILLLALLIVGVAVTLFYSGEPAVDGERLSHWLREGREQIVSDSLLHNKHIENEADRAVRKIGERAIPVLLAKLCSQDLTWWDSMAEWVDDKIDVSLPKPAHEAKNDRLDAMYGFQILGTQAVAAIPELTRMLYQTNFSSHAGHALGHIGRDATPAIRAALVGGNSRVQFGALSSTYWSQDIGTNVLSEMKTLLRSQDERTAALAVLRLRSFLSTQEYMDLVTQVPGTNHFRIQRLALNQMILTKTNLTEAVPGVLPLLESADTVVRVLATNALIVIAPAIAFTHGIDTNPPPPRSPTRMGRQTPIAAEGN